MAEGTASAKIVWEQDWNVQGTEIRPVGLELNEGEHSMEERMLENRQEPVPGGLGSHSKELWFYSKVNRKTLEGFQGSNIM